MGRLFSSDLFMKLIGWAVDNGPGELQSYYPAERFRKALYRPDVIKKAFELGSVT